MKKIIIIDWSRFVALPEEGGGRQTTTFSFFLHCPHILQVSLVFFGVIAKEAFTNDMVI